MREHQKHIRVGIGASSIMMIFVVLCMMILSVLSYHTALQKEHIADRFKQVQEEYTKADAMMQFVIEEVKIKQQGLALTEEQYQWIQKHGISYEAKENLLILTCSINSTQVLEAELMQMQGEIVIKRYEVTTKGV